MTEPTLESGASLSGKTILVTGATSGIGLESAVDLGRLGARLVLVGRDPAKTKRTVEEVKRRSGSTTVDSLLCDFASQAAVRRLAEEFRATGARLDVLLNNAGTVSDERRLTQDGVELTFAVNHLGTYLLTRLLVDALVASAPARVVNVASTVHYQGTMDLADLGYEKGYSLMKSYARAKLGVVLFTRELSRRLAGRGVTVNAMHPGAVATAIWDGAPRWTQPLLSVAKRLMDTPAEGGARLTYLAASAEVKDSTGLYFEKSRPRTPSALARDDALAARLWDESARLVKLSPKGASAVGTP